MSIGYRDPQEKPLHNTYMANTRIQPNESDKRILKFPEKPEENTHKWKNRMPKKNSCTPNIKIYIRNGEIPQSIHLP